MKKIIIFLFATLSFSALTGSLCFADSYDVLLSNGGNSPYLMGAINIKNNGKKNGHDKDKNKNHKYGYKYRNGSKDQDGFPPVTTPEPISTALFGLGGVLMALKMKRKNRRE